MSQPVPAKEYGIDLPFRLPLPDRSADDVVLALCAGQGGGGAVPADDRCMLHTYAVCTNKNCSSLLVSACISTHSAYAIWFSGQISQYEGCA